MTRPTKADIKRIKDKCAKDHLATSNTTKSQLQIDRIKVQYCNTHEMKLLEQMAAKSMRKTCEVETRMLSLAIDIWTAKLNKLEVGEDASRYILHDLIKNANAKILVRKTKSVNANRNITALCTGKVTGKWRGMEPLEL